MNFVQPVRASKQKIYPDAPRGRWSHSWSEELPWSSKTLSKLEMLDVPNVGDARINVIRM